MLIGTWFALQGSYTRSTNLLDTDSTARDAVSTIGVQIRDAQPQTITTPAAGPSLWRGPTRSTSTRPTTSPGTAKRRHRHRDAAAHPHLSEHTTDTLYWQQDSNKDGSWDAGDTQVVLARNVVNGSTPVFTYECLSSGTYTSANSIAHRQPHHDRLGDREPAGRPQPSPDAEPRRSADHGRSLVTRWTPEEEEPS